MTGVTGLGGWPGADVLAAQTVVLDDLVAAPAGVSGLPFAVAPAGRGPYGEVLGRSLGLLVDLPVELGPHGWALADRPGRDAARLESLAREDGEALAIAAHGYAGPVVLAVTGPVTLGASVYLARGDRAVADPGALRELAESLVTGIVERVGDLVRAVPGAQPVVLLHEPLLAAARAGVLPSFSGYSRLRALDHGVVVERLASVVRGAHGGGVGRVVLHIGSAAGLVGVAGQVGADAFGIEVAALGPGEWERIAEAVEAGTSLWAQVPAQGTSQCAGPDVQGQARTVTVPWRRVGLAGDGLADVVLLAGDPRSGATPDDARRALGGLVLAARVVADG